MNAPLKLSLFGLGLVALFATSLGVGRLVGPVTATPEDGHADHGGPPAGNDVELPGGLQVAQDGYRLQLLTPALSTSAAEPLRLRVLGPDGTPVTSYTPTHDKDLHLIVVRRDLTGFQHVHPTLAGDGVWQIPLRVGTAGQYRVFADFQPAGRDRSLVLGADLPAAGRYEPAPLPPIAQTTTVDGYTVTINGQLAAGATSTLTFDVATNGKPVTDLQPYLAAYGHLVALRDGDLAYLHVHPAGHPGDGQTSPGPRIAFQAEVPSAGAYRLFLDFQHEGVVRTAAFTIEAGSPTGPAPASTNDHGGHS